MILLNSTSLFYPLFCVEYANRKGYSEQEKRSCLNTNMVEEETEKHVSLYTICPVSLCGEDSKTLGRFPRVAKNIIFNFQLNI
jgi:hypothetical protein